MKRIIKRAVLGLALAALALGAGAKNNADHSHDDFTRRIAGAPCARVKAFFDTVRFSGPAEREAMEFLYAYMPLPDMMNYPPEYHLENVRMSLRTRREMAWGDSVPEREFRHFVLPARVNNEDLDRSRQAFYEELRPRLVGLSMCDAILEVNHWCHEKATYRPSDARTSSPLSTVSQAIGRCGEESTFTVAALRAVGIPARQVYTPRWAHTDDNHAWVEAWADGGWWFLGACEPEPVLNMAWFNSPASRGMLMNTKVYGRYDGPEEQLGRTAVNTEINVTENYAPVARAEVQVVDERGNAVGDAEVLFSIYNYGEYYPVATKRSDSSGGASLLSGKGDMVVWASAAGKFGFAKVRAGAGPVRVTLDKDASYTGSVDFDLTPPRASAELPRPTAAQIAANDRRKQREDSIRSAYESTFVTDSGARRLAALLELDPDSLARVLTLSRGNHAALEGMLSDLPQPSRATALWLLLGLAEKDLRDIPVDVIMERLNLPMKESAVCRDYVLNPRVEYEGLAPVAGPLLNAFDPAVTERWRRDPAQWAEWVARAVEIDTVWNPGRLRMHPEAVWRGRKADRLSRYIFFVASARIMGIPARIDPVTGKTQWHDGAAWVDAAFAEAGKADTHPAAAQGEVELLYTPTRQIPDPKYYTLFSISKIENGRPRLLEFPEDVTLGWINSNYRKFDAGQYLLTTGQRLADGSVLSRSVIFGVTPGGVTKVPVEIRQDSTAIQVIGSFNSEHLYRDREGKERSLLSATGRGYYVLVYGNPNHEPTAHVLNEISALGREFEAAGRKIMLIYADADRLERAGVEKFRLPACVEAGSDIDGAMLSELAAELHLAGEELPVVVVADTFNRVVYATQGYSIGTAARLLHLLSRLAD